MEGLVEGRVDGIGPSEVSASRHAARFSGLGGLILPQGWDRPIQPAGYTIETFVKPGKPPFTGEQTVVMGGRVIVCDGVGREACMQSLMIENQGGKGGFEIILRPSGGTGDALELGARVTINGGAGKLTADLFAQEARAILPETWSHVALSVGAQYASLYLNATLVARSAVIGSMWDGKNMRVGMSEHGAWSGGWLRGVVDELAVYTREIEQLRLAVHHSVLLYETEAAPQGDCIRLAVLAFQSLLWARIPGYGGWLSVWDAGDPNRAVREGFSSHVTLAGHRRRTPTWCNRARRQRMVRRGLQAGGMWHRHMLPNPQHRTRIQTTVQPIRFCKAMCLGRRKHRRHWCGKHGHLGVIAFDCLRQR